MGSNCDSAPDSLASVQTLVWLLVLIIKLPLRC